jgi:hypothetical protein
LWAVASTVAVAVLGGSKSSTVAVAVAAAVLSGSTIDAVVVTVAVVDSVGVADAVFLTYPQSPELALSK